MTDRTADQSPHYRLFVRHLARHVVWPNVLIIWLLLVLLVWGNPRWWAGLLIGLVVVPVSAVQAHLLGCSIPKDVAANAPQEQRGEPS